MRGIGTGALAALVALAVHSALDFNLRIPSNAALAALAAAAAAGAAGVRPRPLPRAGALGLAAGALVLLLAAASLPDRPWLVARQEAVQAAASTAPAVRRLRLERAEVALVRLLGRRPAHAESWLLLAGTRAALGDAAAGAALARHAAWLDPGRPGLAEAVDRPVRGGAGGRLDLGRRARVASPSAAHDRLEEPLAIPRRARPPRRSRARPASRRRPAAERGAARAAEPAAAAPQRRRQPPEARAPSPPADRSRPARSSSRRRSAPCARASRGSRRRSRASARPATRSEEEIRALADQDPLTGLASARRFGDRLAVAVIHAQRYRQKLAVVQLGLDRFSRVNERLGRSHGDDLLRSVALALESTLRQGDTIARISGDVFTILLPGIKRDEDVTVIADKLRLALRSPFSIGGHDLLVTASLGIALFPDDGPDTESLLQSATVSMRRAKEKRRRRLGRARPPLARPRRRAAGEGDARCGGRSSRESCELYWQPVVECETRRHRGRSSRSCAGATTRGWRARPTSSPSPT